ncbi:ribonuclease P protein component [Rhodohalobacter halophilus]|uniref:ribonuclease P protein component n=1 Tax=Rhodohalobacter halophilus TaxID=1812810 RepID=UPI00083F798E|nr:ribonuclease P protein component [Rhodohalobacter halophilus]
MKKDRNSPDSKNTDYSLPRSKILRGQKNFQRLFEKSTVLNSDSIQFRYRVYPDSKEGFQIGFAAPKKKIPKAAHRNRTKRLMREVYRHHQALLSDLFDTNNTKGFHGLFLANRSGLSYQAIEADMIPMLQKTRDRLQRIIPQQEDGNRPSTEDFN